VNTQRWAASQAAAVDAARARTANGLLHCLDAAQV
jgi:hypothetical protein